MTDVQDTTTSPETVPAPVKGKRPVVSKRTLLDAAGKETEDYVGCGGFRYESLSEPGTYVEALFDGEGENVLPQGSILGLAAFGGLTLAGNVTNTIRNGEPKADGPQTEKEALEAWIANLIKGDWTKPTGELEPGIGTLAIAVARHFTARDGQDRGDDKIAAILDWLKGLDKDTRKGWRNDPGVKVHLKQVELEKAQANAKLAPAKEAPAIPAGL